MLLRSSGAFGDVNGFLRHLAILRDDVRSELAQHLEEHVGFVGIYSSRCRLEYWTVNNVLKVLFIGQVDARSGIRENIELCSFDLGLWVFSSTVVDAPHVKSERMFVLTIVIVVEGFNLSWCFLLCRSLCLLSSVTINWLEVSDSPVAKAFFFIRWAGCSTSLVWVCSSPTATNCWFWFLPWWSAVPRRRSSGLWFLWTCLLTFVYIVDIMFLKASCLNLSYFEGFTVGRFEAMVGLFCSSPMWWFFLSSFYSKNYRLIHFIAWLRQTCKLFLSLSKSFVMPRTNFDRTKSQSGRTKIFWSLEI